MRLFRILTLSALFLGLSSVYAVEMEVITIAASPTPHADILRQVKPILAKEGIDLQIKEFSDYIQPNLAVAQKQMDANYFQHKPYLAEFNKTKGTDLVELVAVHIEPMAVYASEKQSAWAKTKNVKKLASNLKIGVPNDPTNEGRALSILQKNGFLTLKAGVAFPTKRDIASNPYSIEIVELDAAMLPRVLKSKQLDFAVINSNFALGAKLNPLKDAVFIESNDSPYANIVAVRPEELKEAKIQKLAKAMHNPKIRAYILNTYKGIVIPVF